MRTSSSVHVEDLLTSILDAESTLAHVDDQPKAILSDVVSIDPIVDSEGGVAAGRPLHPARLGTRPGWARTSVLSVRDPEVRMVRFDLDTLDGLDRVRDVGVVDERTVPDSRTINIRDRRCKRAVSCFSFKNEFNITEFAEVLIQPLLTEGFEVPDVSYVHVPRSTGADGECEGGGNWTGVLAPADLSLQSLRVKPWNEAT